VAREEAGMDVFKWVYARGGLPKTMVQKGIRSMKF
jgi:hypothetical protein